MKEHSHWSLGHNSQSQCREEKRLRRAIIFPLQFPFGTTVRVSVSISPIYSSPLCASARCVGINHI